MAERRMIAKSIIKSDQFLDMPATTQCLYFHLLLEADDDGFINAPKSIMRVIGAKDDDMRVLQAKGYIIPFESGVIVIKHWRLHNSLRKDRYNPNPQLENERKQLVVADNKEYQLATNWQPNGNQLATNWQPNGNQLATSGIPLVATGKDRLGKDRLGKDREEEEKEDPSASSDILKMYGDNIHPVSSPVEAEKLKTLVDTHGEPFVAKAIERAVMRNKRSLAYITGILNNWEANGYDEGIEGKRTEKQSDPERSADLERFMREREEHKKKQRRF